MVENNEEYIDYETLINEGKDELENQNFEKSSPPDGVILEIRCKKCIKKHFFA